MTAEEAIQVQFGSPNGEAHASLGIGLSKHHIGIMRRLLIAYILFSYFIEYGAEGADECAETGYAASKMN